MSSIPSSFPRTVSAEVEFQCLRTPPAAAQAQGKLFEVVFALLKTVQQHQPADLAYHLTGGLSPCRAWPGAGERYRVEVVTTGTAPAALDPWLGAVERCDYHGTFRGRVVRSGTLDDPIVPFGNPPAEVCLDFRTPLRFERTKGSPPTALRFDELLRLLHLMATRWQIPLDLAPADGAVQVLSHCWNYWEYWRPSASHKAGRAAERHRRGPGSGLQRYNGCIGPLYLRGAPQYLLMALRLAERLHLGGAKRLNGFGHFSLTADFRPFFDHALMSVRRIQGVIDSLGPDSQDVHWVQGCANDGHDAARWGERIGGMLREGRYEARPTTVRQITPVSGRSRQIEQLSFVDRVVQTHLKEVLTPALDRLFSDAAHGFRPHRSVGTLAAAVRRTISPEWRFFVRADIRSFFQSIRHEVLLARLTVVLPNADTATRWTLEQCIRTPRGNGTADGELRLRGLAEGAPLSPLLSNVFLMPLDQRMQAGAWRYFRFADDILMLAPDCEGAEEALAVLRTAVNELGLTLTEAKTQIGPVDGGFAFVGEKFGTDPAPPDPVAAFPAQKRPAVVVQPYTYLGVNGDALEQRRKDRLVATVPLRKISELVVLGPASVSSALMARLGRFGIPLSIALEGGHRVATLTPASRQFLAIGARHANWYAALSDADRLALAMRIVTAKIGNYVAWMAPRRRRGDAHTRSELEAAMERLGAADTLEALRGHEGLAARLTFAWLNTQIRKDLARWFVAERRERPARDRLNSLLSFGYFLLAVRLNALIRSHGLNPYLGVLHDGQDNYETLVADLQELFRVHVDRAVLRIINLGVIGPNDFQTGDRGARLHHDAAGRFVDALESAFGDSPGGLTVRDALVIQVRSLRSTVMDGAPLWLYGWRTGTADTDRERDEAPTEDQVQS